MLELKNYFCIVANLYLIATQNSFETLCGRCIYSVPRCACIRSSNAKCNNFNISVVLYNGLHMEHIPDCAIGLPRENLLHETLIGEKNRYDSKTNVFAFMNISVAPRIVKFQIVSNVTHISVLNSLIMLFFSNSTCIGTFILTANEITSTALYKLCDLLRSNLCNINARIELSSTTKISFEFLTDVPKFLIMNLSRTALSIAAPSVLIKTSAFHNWELDVLTIQNVTQLEKTAFAAAKISSLKLHFKANFKGIHISDDAFNYIEQPTSIKFDCSSSSQDSYYCFLSSFCTFGLQSVCVLVMQNLCNS